MEKKAASSQREESESYIRPSGHLANLKGLLLLLASLVLLHRSVWSWTWIRGADRSSSNHSDFDWDRIHSHRHLKYHLCSRDREASFECARLSVPLDHFNGSTDAEVSLAIIRLPAAVPPTHPQYGGAILFNPGGPGGSGVDFLPRFWEEGSAAIHYGQVANDTKFYDFISFDPRGIGHSTPNVRCFDNKLLGWTWALRVWEEGVLGSSDAAFGRLWSMSRALGGSCSLSADHNPQDIKRFVSTASVAADMVDIIERHGEWREAEARRLLSRRSTATLPNHLKHKHGEEKINYWGFSYGTYLGMTFASMYPDRINRLIVDGVVDAVDYTKSLWFDNLVDTEQEMRSFHTYCASAGFPACALATKNKTTTADDVERRVQAILNGLLHNPLPVVGANPEVITYSDVKHLIFAGLYTPLQSFPIIANALEALENGDGSLLAELTRHVHEPYCPSADAARALAPKPLTLNLAHEVTMSIACSDGDSQASLTRDGAREHWKKLAEMSPTIGPMWAMFRMQCARYTVRPLYRYAGPWVGNTSYPILFIGNSADPVTPVRNARKMAKGYRGARVLEQESSGHCTGVAPSKCTREVVYRYFQHGELPEHDAHCAVDEYPFQGKTEDGWSSSAVLDNQMSTVWLGVV